MTTKMRYALFALIAVSIVQTAACEPPTRLLTNTEGDKPFTLSSKQWLAILLVGIIVFIGVFLLLGLCCNAEVRTREASSTLTTSLTDGLENHEPEKTVSSPAPCKI